MTVQGVQVGVQDYEGDDYFVAYFPRDSLQHGTAPATPPQTRHGTRARRWVWDLGRAGLVALGYFLSAKVGLAFVVQPEGLAAVWPPSSFLLAVLILSPQRTWAVILGGVLSSNTVANLTAGLSLTVSLGFSLGLGMLVLAPTTVMWVTTDRSLCKTGTVVRIVEAVCLYASLVMMTHVIFGVRPEMEHGPFPLPFLPWPYIAYTFLFWTALRFGPHGTSIACLALATVAVWNTAHTLGPFAGAGRSVAEQVLANLKVVLEERGHSAAAL